MKILKSVLWSILRYWAASLLTILVAHHWITPDLQHQVTVWFDGWLDVALTTLLAAAIPIAFSIWANLKNRLKIKLALLLPGGTSEADMHSIVQAAPISAVLTADARKAINS